MKWSELSLTQKIAGVAGVILVINLFLPWYSFLSISRNAFQSPASPLAFIASLLAIAAVVFLLLPAFGKNAPQMGSLKGQQIALLAAGLAVILIVLRWLTESDFVSFGLFLGLIASGAVAYASFAAMKDAGLELPSADDFKSMGGGDEGGGE